MPSKPETHNRYMREVWYPKNKAKHVALVRQSKRRKAQMLWNYKHERGCENCGENFPPCLDFHHKDSDKEYLVSTMPNNGRSWDSILKEISKCQLLCANCHRKEHHKSASIE